MTRIWIALLGALAMPFALEAQVQIPRSARDDNGRISGDTPTASNETARARYDSLTPPVRVWLSGGIGPSSFMRTGGIGLRSAANVSYRRAVVMVRGTMAFEGIDGYASTDEKALLAGIRIGGSHFYMIPAAGVGKTKWKDDAPCEFRSCTATERLNYRGESQSLALDLGLHASVWIVGFAVNASMMTGPANGQLFTLAFSPELGWFGR